MLPWSLIIDWSFLYKDKEKQEKSSVMKNLIHFRNITSSVLLLRNFESVIKFDG